MSVKAGQKDWRVKVFSVVEAADADGTETIKEYLCENGKPKVYCAYYRKNGGGLTVAADAVIADCEAFYVVNYHPEITAGMYVEDMVTGRFYCIKFADDFEGKHTDLTLYCKAYYGMEGGGGIT